VGIEYNVVYVPKAHLTFKYEGTSTWQRYINLMTDEPKKPKWRRLENGEIEYDSPAFKPENLIPAITKLVIDFVKWPINICSKLWQGKYPLRWAFWWFYIFGYMPFCFFMLIVGLPLQLLGIPAIHMLMPIGMLYVPLVSVGVWRSATAYEGEGCWSIAAKIIIVCGGARYVYFLANGGFEHILSLAT
jgi:hypothetical protein